MIRKDRTQAFRLIEYALLVLGVLVLLGLLASQFTRVMRAWPSEDYRYFRSSAEMLLSGISPYSRPKLFYPLYTVFWLFLPLTLGDWTRWLWMLAPVAFLHLTLGRKAILLWPFYPLLVHLRFGQVDGWLILPLIAMLRNWKRAAPIGAALSLFKPQSAWSLLLYRLWQWVRARSWPELAVFAATAFILIAPSFILMPNWVPEWFASVRAHPPEQCQNATIWGWSCFGTPWLALALLEGLFALFLLRATDDQSGAIFLFGVLITPILYSYDYVLVATTVKSWRETALLTAISWLAVGIDVLAGGWGGAYSLIPLAALAMRSRSLRSIPLQLQSRSVAAKRSGG